MGKSSSVTVGHKIFLGGHVVFCHGPIDSIDTIEWDSRPGWRGLATGGSITVDAENLFGGSKEPSTTPGFGGGDNSDADGVSGEIDILMGGPTQTQNSYLQSVLGELIPAFRGVVSFVLKQLYVGNSPSLRPLAAWGTRIHVKDDGQPQWYDEKAAIASNDSASYISRDSLWRYKVFNQESVQAPSGVVDLPATAPLYENSAPGTVDLDGFWYENNAPFGYDSASDPVYLADINTIISPTGGVQIWAIKEIETHTSNLTITLVAENSAHLYVDGVYSFSANPTNYDGAGYTEIKTINLPKGRHEIAVLVMNEKPEASGPPHPLGDKMFFYATCQDFPQVDINPAHFLRECYTSTVWGLKLPEYKINDASFTAAADKLFAEGMGISLLWDRQGPVSELIDEIKRHIDADIYEDNEGLITLKLIRDDYVYDDLDVYDESNIIRIERGASTPERELINTVTVVYWDATTGKDASVKVPHAALVQMQGRENPTTIRYDFFTNADIATKKGEYDLRVMTSSLITYKVVTNRASEEKTIGDRFILNRPDVNAHNMVVRIIDVDLGNGINNEIIFTVTQEVFSLPAVPVMATSPDAVWVDPVQPARPAPARLVFEQPYYELVQYQGQTEVDALLTADDTLAMLGVAAIRPPIISLDAQVIVDDGAGYHEASTLDYCPSALLATAMTYTTKNITFTDEVDLDLVSLGTHCQIDDELLVVEALDLVARTATLGRGVLDTVPAKEHLVGARIWFWDYYRASDSVTYSDGENVDVKILTNSSLGRLPVSSAPVDSFEFVGRAARPYPPGKLLINDLEYPEEIDATDELRVAAAHRDRLLQTAGTLQDTTVGDIGPEPGTTYNFRFYDVANTLLRSVSQSAAIYTYTASDEMADSGLSELLSQVRVELESVRDGLVSFQKHNFTAVRSAAVPITYAATFLNPSDKDSRLTLSNANLTVVRNSGTANWACVRSAVGKNKGKFYFEIINNANGGTAGDAMWGFIRNSDALTTYPGNSSLGVTSMGWEPNTTPNSTKFQNGSLGAVSAYGTVAAGQYSQFAIDFDAGKLWVKNSANANWAGGGNPSAGTTPTFTFAANTHLHIALAAYSNPQSATANFGASAFSGTVPSGFEAGWKAPAVPLTMTYSSRFSTPSSTDAQGVVTDGVHVWYSSSTTIYKYTKAGVLVTSRNVIGDAPTDKVQVNGLCIRLGVLYVSAAKYVSSTGTSWIVQYDPDTLAYISHNVITGNWFSEGITFKNGNFWVCFHANNVVAKVDPTSWAVLATYPLTFLITGSSGGYGSGVGYDGLAWKGNYLFCNIHEIYDQDYLDVYYFDGTGFIEVGRLNRPTSISSQGFCFDPSDPNAMWFAERNYSGTDSVAKITF